MLRSFYSIINKAKYFKHQQTQTQIQIQIKTIMSNSNSIPIVQLPLPSTSNINSTTTNSIPKKKKSPKAKKQSTTTITTTTAIINDTPISTLPSISSYVPSASTSTSTSTPTPSTNLASNSNSISSTNNFGRTILTTTKRRGGIEFNPSKASISSTSTLSTSINNSINNFNNSKRSISDFSKRTLINTLSSNIVSNNQLETRTIPSDSDGGVGARSSPSPSPSPSPFGAREGVDGKPAGNGVGNGVGNRVGNIKIQVPTNRIEVDQGEIKKRKSNAGKKKGKGGAGGVGGGGGGGGELDNRVLLKSISNGKDGEKVDLSEEIERLYEAQKATPASLIARERLIQELTSIFNSEPFWFGHSHQLPLTIEPFGSVRFGLATSSSDLDLCLFDPYRPNGFEEKFYRSFDKGLRILPDIYNMRLLAKVLMKEGFSKIVPIPNAGVPIVKFEAVVDGMRIQVDINTNERLGVLNSRLIDAYCNLHPLVRPLSVFIKFWAKQRRLNDPSGNLGQTTFSSYTLILLVINYLQHIKLLPNLQDDNLIDLKRLEKKFFWSKPKPKFKGRNNNRYVGFSTSVGWDVTFVEDLKVGIDWHRGTSTSHSSSSTSTSTSTEEESKTEEEPNLKELARGFFEYYSSGKEFNFNTMAISIRSGKPLLRVQPFLDPFMLENSFELHPNLPTILTTSSTSNDVEHSLPSPTTTSDLLSPTLPLTAQRLNNDLDLAEIRRQESEDDALLAMAESVKIEDTSDSNNGELGGRMTDTRASSPLEYGDFVEPLNWIGKCIVQDPFLVERNTAGNIEPNALDALVFEMSRALELINSNAPLSEICNHITLEPAYQALIAQKKDLERAKQNKREGELQRADFNRKEKLKLNVPERRQLSNSEVLNKVEMDLKEVDREIELAAGGKNGNAEEKKLEEGLEKVRAGVEGL